MARTRLIVDGETLLDADLNTWTEVAPEFVAKHLNPAANPQPWMKCAAIIIVTALATAKPTTLTITTHNHGWTMNFDET